MVKWIVRALAVLIFGPIVLLALWLAALPIYVSNPEYFGHYEFYTACKSIRKGMTLEEARAAMGSFLEVGRTWKPDNELHAGIMGATMQGVAETKAEHVSRILFIPGEKDLADWCIVYPERGKIARVEISPD